MLNESLFSKFTNFCPPVDGRKGIKICNSKIHRKTIKTKKNHIKIYKGQEISQGNNGVFKFTKKHQNCFSNLKSGRIEKK